MRILAVLRARSWGGSSRSLADVLNHWIESHDVWLATADEQPEGGAPRFDARIAHVSLAKSASTAFSAAQLPVVRSLRGAIRDVRPDVVLSWGTWANLVAIPARVGTSVPLVISERVDPRERGGTLRQTMRTTTYRFGRPEAFVTLTEELARWARTIVPSARVEAIGNLVRAPGVRADPGDSMLIVAAGRLVPQKGFDLLIEAFASVAPARPGWRLRIAGDGDDRAKLETLAREHAVADRVELPGLRLRLDGDLADAAFFVLSSRFEGFGRVLTEALAAGVPVVAFDCRTGPAEIVRHEVDGLLVPPGDVPRLADGMARLMDDAALRRAMAARAPEVLDRFGAEAILARWDALLRDVAR